MWLALLFACIPVLTSPGDPVSGDYIKPENAWPAAESVPDLLGEGFAEGEVVEHWMGPDQNGQEVDLWQFYGQVWVLDISTIWCQPCQDIAADAQATADDYAADGFVYLTLLAEDEYGEVPDEADLDFWADTFGITQPVVSDDTQASADLTGGQFPFVAVVGRDLTVSARVEVPSDESIRAAIEAAL